MEQRPDATWKTIQLDENGDPMVMHLYDDKTGLKIEERIYSCKQLRMLKVIGQGEIIQTFYHSDTDTPVIEFSTRYTNNNKDSYQTIFNRDGNQIYSIQVEQVNEFHVRRYSNDTLLYEFIQNTQPPSFTYFYPNGSKLINYTSNGDGSGIWHLYDETGISILSMDEPNEANPANFYSSKIPKPWDPKQAGWELAIIHFKERHHDMEIDTKLYGLEVSDKLAVELKKVKWDYIDSAYGEAYNLPFAINGMLSDDEEVAMESSRLIWAEILHQGSIYECTYKVAGILALMLPSYINDQPVKHRLIEFLYHVLNQPNIREEKTFYTKLIKSIKPAVPLIEQISKDTGNDITHPAQFLLSQISG